MFPHYEVIQKPHAPNELHLASPNHHLILPLTIFCNFQQHNGANFVCLSHSRSHDPIHNPPASNKHTILQHNQDYTNQMKYDECLQVLSPARLNKYAQASGCEKAKTLRLYQYNIKLSQRFYGVIGMFEIMLRNAINAHYKQYFNDDNWIINQARPNGLLEQEASEIVRIQRTYTNMGVYNNDKMVASFTFGFWTYLFTRRNYRIGGKTLLQIFPNKAHGLKQTDIYKQLTAIREFRNRIAHHEPICFNATRAIDTKYAKEHYELIRTYIEYMGFDSDSVLRMVEKPDSILKVIDGMK